MSRRLGRIALLAVLLSVLASAYVYSIQRVPRYAGGVDSKVLEAINQRPIDAAVEARIESLRPVIAGLSETPPGDWEPLHLALLGYRDITPPEVAPEPLPDKVPEPVPEYVPEPREFQYLVSMTYISADRRFAVIDGRFYREGARLPGGELIDAISPSAIRIRYEDRTHWLEISKEPAPDLNTGGVIRTDSADNDDSPGLPVASPTTPSEG